MRKFSEIEKETIQQIVEGTKTSLTYLPINAFNDIFQHYEGVVFDANSSALLFYSSNGTIPPVDYMLGFYNKVIEKTYLIDYLEKDRALYFINMPTANQLTRIGIQGSGTVPYSIPLPPDINGILSRCMNYPVCISETLRTYVSDGFLSYEEQTLLEAQKQTASALEQAKKANEQVQIANRQTRLSVLAVIISFATMLFGLVKDCSNNKDAEISATASGIYNYLKNNIGIKLQNIQDNTSNIVSNSGDTVIINCCHCRHPVVPPSSPCIKRVKVNTCRDTVISKESLKYTNNKTK